MARPEPTPIRRGPGDPRTALDPLPGPVWYAAYGSNLDAARFACYLGGGRPVGGFRDHPGCRDSTPPRTDRPVLLPGGLYFALESRTWSGGMAFYDPELPGSVAARAYLLSADQFADVAAQEMHRVPGGPPDLIATAVASGRASAGPGRYETVVCAGILDGRPVLTLTAPWRAGDVPPNPPAPAYVATITRGLRDSHGWTDDQIARYLARCHGVPQAPPPA
ncbi:histone deacetylase [Plantactinospora sp. WMMB334]|uniref:histone deacetylase n=1 Tax=Plantactinospora sp. WMMB334 TaxID=3404119 RepID=UPI003B92CB59